MRSRILAIAGISAAALAATTAFAGTAGAHGAPAALHVGKASISHASAAKNPCYSLTTDDSGVGIVSQNFTDSGFDIYNSAGAADISVKKKCSINSVSTTGVYFNGAGPADSVNVLIYKNKKGLPGAVKNEQDALSYTDSTGLGSLAASPKTIKLKKGKYFLSFVANMAFASGGEWGWELSSDQNGNEDVWENPGGGLGTSCSSWGDNTTCLGFGSDYMFTAGH